jgi:hypothetical protein
LSANFESRSQINHAIALNRLLAVLLEVRDSFLQNRNIVSGLSEKMIAPRTQEPTYSVRAVAVIYMFCSLAHRPEGPTANRTTPILLSQEST